jgi:hypothetical protein
MSAPFIAYLVIQERERSVKAAVGKIQKRHKKAK